MRKYVKLEGFQTESGNVNYKGLDINLFVAGSQVYDFEEDIFLVITDEEDIEMFDAQELKAEEYNDMKREIQKRKETNHKSYEEEVTELKQLQAEQDEAIMLLMLGGL